MKQEEFGKEKIISLAREFVESTECSCQRGFVCWKCLFEYNLSFVDSNNDLNKCPHHFFSTDGVHVIAVDRCGHPKAVDWRE